MFLTRRFYLLMTVVILLTAAGFAIAPLFVVGRVLLLLLSIVVAADVWLLWSRRGITAMRLMSERFSNGDDNDVRIRLESNYGFPVDVEVIDEIPFVFQRRNVSFRAALPAKGEATVKYQLRPTHRGVYGFGRVRVFAATRLALVQRRYTCDEARDVKVYPSYMMLRQYELLAISNNLTEMGIKRIRRIGHNTDFDQIKDYVVGDDYRTINWRATARRHQLMVNVYQEERAQHVYAIIDKGRMMQQAFQDMTLLDYAINASLVLSFVAVNKQDKAGLITFADQFETFVPASNQPGHMQTMQETLYAEQTVFGETDYSALLVGLAKHVNRRSLLVLFTSFTSMAALRRQLPFLRQLALRHRLLVVFFADEELREYVTTEARTVESVYQHVIAEKFQYEQRTIVQTLRQYGIQSLLTTPKNLSVEVINKYLEIKSKF
ncbi:DUF58 domain-containing protein [Xylanibacter brevis]|uniref:DUF58 domain-containing protein n=1 Tax=Xylanibacter brevis TaxID=83231 RepID=UPI0004896747|nr:DUF58 domain-containing protein [Xylanibacter brevis]